MTRAARWYVGALTVVGTAGLVHAIGTMTASPFEFEPTLLVRYLPLVMLAVLSGFFPIRIPGLEYNIYLSETFFFALALLFGGERAAVWLAIDGLIIAIWRKYRQPLRVMFNFAEPIVSMLAASIVFYRLYGGPPLAVAPASGIGALLLPAAAMATVYVLMNTGLTALAMWSAGEPSLFPVWRKNLTWFSLSYFGGASMAVLLAFNWQTISMSALALTVPLIVIFWLIFKNLRERASDAEQHLREQRDLARKHLDEQRELYISTVEALAMAIEAKDEGTHGHVKRVRRNAVRLARALGVSDETELMAIENGALLHDIGKLKVPEHILHKPGRLTPYEYEQIKMHAPVGADILKKVPFPYPVERIVRHHHENWDGTGYPDGLRGQAIPLGARIIAVMDCYEALREDRPYRPALSDEEATAIIEARKGTMYDPAVTDAFLELRPEVAAEIDAHNREVKASVVVPDQQGTGPAASSGASSPALAAALLALSDLAAEIAGHTPVEDLAAAIGSRLRQTVPCDLIAFYLHDRVSDDLVVVHAAGTCADAVKNLRLKAGQGLSGWVAINRTTIVNSSGALDLGDRAEHLQMALEAALATPLCANGAVVGVMTLYAAARDSFTTEHQQVVEFAARQIGPALERALGFERERTASLFDAETGLPNEKYLERVLASTAYCGHPDGPKPGILMLESPNGAGPGRAGDAGASDLPLRLAAVSRTAVRVTDLVFRTGVYQFAILMADSTPEAMANVARRVGEAMRDASGDGRPPLIESSFALFPDHAAEPGDLLRAARARRQAAAALARRSPS